MAKRRARPRDVFDAMVFAMLEKIVTMRMGEGILGPWWWYMRLSAEVVAGF